MERINFNKNIKMHLACSTSDLRSSMQYIYFSGGFAYASDAHILIKNKIDEISQGLSTAQIDALNGKLLHKDFYKEILKYDFIEVFEDGIECKGKNSEKAFFYFCADENIKYPNADSVIDGIRDCKSEPINRISISANLMNIVASTLPEANNVILNFKGDGNGMLITNNGDGESLALLMPLIIQVK